LHEKKITKDEDVIKKIIFEDFETDELNKNKTDTIILMIILD
jgi:hypothetical protein